jgi:hypothetical protein
VSIEIENKKIEQLHCLLQKEAELTDDDMLFLSSLSCSRIIFDSKIFNKGYIEAFTNYLGRKFEPLELYEKIHNLIYKDKNPEYIEVFEKISSRTLFTIVTLILRYKKQKEDLNNWDDIQYPIFINEYRRLSRLKGIYCKEGYFNDLKETIEEKIKLIENITAKGIREYIYLFPEFYFFSQSPTRPKDYLFNILIELIFALIKKENSKISKLKISSFILYLFNLFNLTGVSLEIEPNSLSRRLSLDRSLGIQEKIEFTLHHFKEMIIDSLVEIIKKGLVEAEKVSNFKKLSKRKQEEKINIILKEMRIPKDPEFHILQFFFRNLPILGFCLLASKSEDEFEDATKNPIETFIKILETISGQRLVWSPKDEEFFVYLFNKLQELTQRR